VERLRGYTAAEVMSQALEQVLAPASYQIASKMLEEALAGQRANPEISFGPQTLELELTRKGGGTVWAEVKVSLLRDERGGAVGILGVSRDISERRHAKDRLQKQRQIFFSVREKAPYGVVLAPSSSSAPAISRLRAASRWLWA
jgi:PAS domain S-box-containing protein